MCSDLDSSTISTWYNRLRSQCMVSALAYAQAHKQMFISVGVLIWRRHPPALAIGV